MRDVADTHHLVRRGAVWYYRRRVPEHLTTKIGRSFIQHSLGTKSKAEAKKLRTIEDLKCDALFEDAEIAPLAPQATQLAKQKLSPIAAAALVRSYVERMDKRSAEPKSPQSSPHA
jgi:hypothetical protein